MPSIGVSLWVMLPTVAVLGGGGAWVAFTIIRSRREEPEVVVPSLVGVTGYVVTELSPRGVVQVAGEQWSAVSEGRESIPEGREIRVIQVSGATLTVAPADADSEDVKRESKGYNGGTQPDSGAGG